LRFLGFKKLQKIWVFSNRFPAPVFVADSLTARNASWPRLRSDFLNNNTVPTIYR